MWIKKNAINIIVLSVLLLCVFSLINGVNSIPLILWDESLYSTNAIEMLKKNVWDVHLYDGEIDYYNLKPVFFTWFRASSFYLFGYDLWVHRLPSILFAIATVYTLYWAALKLKLSKLWAAIAAVFLCIAPAYNTLHVVKGGEYDAMLAFVMFAQFLLLLKALNSNNFKWRVFLVISLGLGFYTKSLAGLFFVPGIILSLLIFKKEWFLERRNYLLAFSFLLFPLVYYGFLQLSHPGYVSSIFQHHFLRYGDTLNDVVHPFWYYLKSPSVLPYYLPSLFLSVYLLAKTKALPNWVFIGQIFVLSMLLPISFSQTKHGFYTAAIFPVSALVLVKLLHLFINGLNKQLQTFSKVVLTVFLIFALHFTYAKSQNYWRYYNRSFPVDYVKALAKGNFLMQKIQGEENRGEDPRIYYGEMYGNAGLDSCKTFTVFANDLHIPNSKGYNPHLMFYVNYWRLVKHKNVAIKQEIDNLRPGDTILCCDADRLLRLKESFRLKTIESTNNCQLYFIEGYIK